MKCLLCGNEHEYKCPLIKAFEYYPDGTVMRTEFVTFADMLPINKQPESYFATILPDHPTEQ